MRYLSMANVFSPSPTFSFIDKVSKSLKIEWAGIAKNIPMDFISHCFY